MRPEGVSDTEQSRLPVSNNKEKKKKGIIRKINLINLRFFLSPWQARKESESFLGLSVFVDLLCVDIFAWVCFTRHLTQINGFRYSIVCLWPSESLSATIW